MKRLTKKPVIAPHNFTYKLTEISGWIILVLLWVFVGVNFSRLPSTIPIHFDAGGSPDGYGSKEYIFALPSVTTIIYIIMSAMSRSRISFKYMPTVAPIASKKSAAGISKYLRYLKYLILMIFFFISYKSVKVAMGESEGLGKWFFAVTLGLFFIITVLTILLSLKNIPKESGAA